MKQVSRFGAIDIGSNSLRFLAVASEDDFLHYLDSGIWTVRLAQGMSLSQYEVKGEALNRTLKALERVRERLEVLCVPPENRILFTTESLRSSLNVSEVTYAIEKKAGMKLWILEGEEEAFYSYKGALLGISANDAAVFDLGGGSLELCGGRWSCSLPLGALRVKALFDEDVVAIEDYVGSHLRSALKDIPDIEDVKEIIGVGGTSSTTAMILKKVSIDQYHPSRVHGMKIKKTEIKDLVEALRQMDVEARKRLIGLEPGRSDIIVSGLCVILALLEFLGFNYYFHSECDALWGILAEVVERRSAKYIKIKGINWGV